MHEEILLENQIVNRLIHHLACTVEEEELEQVKREEDDDDADYYTSPVEEQNQYNNKQVVVQQQQQQQPEVLEPAGTMQSMTYSLEAKPTRGTFAETFSSGEEEPTDDSYIVRQHRTNTGTFSSQEDMNNMHITSSSSSSS